MKSKVLYIILAVVTIGGIAGWIFFGKKNAHLKVVPKSALFVYTADLLSLAKKADFEKLRQLPLYQKMESEITESKSERSEMLKNPMDWGIAFSSPVYGYVDTWDDRAMSCFAFRVDDNEEFEKVISQLFVGVRITDKSTFKIAHVENDLSVCWGDRGAVVIVPTTYRTNEDDVEKYAQHIYGLKSDETMANSDEFDEFLDHTGDISAMLNGASLFEILNKEEGVNAEMAQDMSYLKESAMFYSLSFENNKIQFEAHSKFPKAQEDILKEMLKSGISEQHAGLINEGSPMATTAFSFDGAKLYEYITSFSFVKKNLSDVLTQLELSEDELKTLLGGELSYSLNTFKMSAPRQPEYTEEQLQMMDPYERYMREYSPRPSEPELYPVITMNFTTTRYDVVDKLMTKFGRMFGVVPDGEGGYSFPLNYGNTPSFRMSKTAIGYVISNDDDIRTKAMSGKVGELGEPAKTILTKHSVAGWANLDYASYPDALKTTLNDEMRMYSAPFLSYISLFKEARVEGDAESTQLILQLTEGEGNSLYRLFAQADKAATEYEKAREENQLRQLEMMDMESGADATTVAPSESPMQSPY